MSNRRNNPLVIEHMERVLNVGDEIIIEPQDYHRIDTDFGEGYPVDHIGIEILDHGRVIVRSYIKGWDELP